MAEGANQAEAAMAEDSRHLVIEQLYQEILLHDGALTDDIRRLIWSLAVGWLGQGDDLDNHPLIQQFKVSCLLSVLPYDAVRSGLLKVAMELENCQAATLVARHPAMTDAAIKDVLTHAVRHHRRTALTHLIQQVPRVKRVFGEHFPLAVESKARRKIIKSDVNWIFRDFFVEGLVQSALDIAMADRESFDRCVQKFVCRTLEIFSLKKKKMRGAFAKLWGRRGFQIDRLYLHTLCQKESNTKALFHLFCKWGDCINARGVFVLLNFDSLQRKDVFKTVRWILASMDSAFFASRLLLRTYDYPHIRTWARLIVLSMARSQFQEYVQKRTGQGLETFLSLFECCRPCSYRYKNQLDLGYCETELCPKEDKDSDYKKLFRWAVTNAVAYNDCACFVGLCTAYLKYSHSRSTFGYDVQFAFTKVVSDVSKFPFIAETMKKMSEGRDGLELTKSLMKVVFEHRALRTSIDSLKVILICMKENHLVFGVHALFKLLLNNRTLWPKVTHILSEWLSSTKSKDGNNSVFSSLFDSKVVSFSSEMRKGLAALAQWCVKHAELYLAFVLGVLLRNWDHVIFSSQRGLNLQQELLANAIMVAVKYEAKEALVCLFQHCHPTLSLINSFEFDRAFRLEQMIGPCHTAGLDDWVLVLAIMVYDIHINNDEDWSDTDLDSEFSGESLEEDIFCDFKYLGEKNEEDTERDLKYSAERSAGKKKHEEELNSNKDNATFDKNNEEKLHDDRGNTGYLKVTKKVTDDCSIDYDDACSEDWTDVDTDSEVLEVYPLKEKKNQQKEREDETAIVDIIRGLREEFERKRYKSKSSRRGLIKRQLLLLKKCIKRNVGLCKNHEVLSIALSFACDWESWKFVLDLIPRCHNKTVLKSVLEQAIMDNQSRVVKLLTKRVELKKTKKKN